MANIQNNRKNHSMWPLPQNNYNYLRQQWCLHVRPSVRTHVRTYVRTHVCTYTPHVRSYRVSVVQSGQFKICIRAFGRTKIVPHLVPHEALNEALFLYDRKVYDRTTERTTERPKAYDRTRFFQIFGWTFNEETHTHNNNRSECRLSYLFTKACVWHLNALVCLTSTQVNPD